MSAQDILSDIEDLPIPRPMLRRVEEDLNPDQTYIDQAFYSMMEADPELKALDERYAAQFAENDPVPVNEEVVAMPEPGQELNAQVWGNAAYKLAERGERQ